MDIEHNRRQVESETFMKLFRAEKDIYFEMGWSNGGKTFRSGFIPRLNPISIRQGFSLCPLVKERNFLALAYCHMF